MASGRRAPAVRDSFLQCRQKLAERISSMADLMLQVRFDLAERLLIADGLEHRVVSEAPFATRRPDQGPVYPALERLRLAVIGPGNRKRAGKMRVASGFGAGRFDFAPDALHCAC